MLVVWYILNYIPKISHAFNTRTKKESVVSSECLQTPEANIINNINSLYLLIMSRTCESTLCSCLNVKELLAWSRREIWSLSDVNCIRTHNHLVHKRTLNHLAKTGQIIELFFGTYLYGAHVPIMLRTCLTVNLRVRLRTKWFWIRVQ